METERPDLPPDSPEARLEKVVLLELLLHPKMREADLYKMLYQAVLGLDHLDPGTPGFSTALREEWSALPRRQEPRHPLLQQIHPDGGTARLHLVTCRDWGLRLDQVARLLEEQPPRHAKTDDLTNLLGHCAGLAGKGRLPFDPDAILELKDSRPPLKHTPSYGFSSYRVVNDPKLARRTISEWLG
ncbi:hypothetical protein GF402_09015 [Candidatus Fermentibacteria bacterium]|nr:hypothetical protein [Candidatus Fermentibacteria bacterium]